VLALGVTSTTATQDPTAERLTHHAISLDALTKAYGARNAVDALTFNVPSGSVCGFIGPNGAGKTTTLRMLLGLIRPSSGTASVLGQSIDDPTRYIHRVGAMIEGPAFYPTLSGRRNLQVLATLGGVDDARVDELLTTVSMADRSRDVFKSYSLGMKQRVGIAAALLHDPELLVLDEPTNGLDPPGIREVRDLLRTLADAGKTVLVSSHLLDELQHICDYVVIIRNGALIFDGATEDLVAMQQPELTATTERAGDIGELMAIAERSGYPATILDGALHVAAPASWAAQLNRSAMAEDITLTSLGVVEARLEDIFFELTEGDRK
jgi:ABC-2 type transport system ATP-binding protein